MAYDHGDNYDHVSDEAETHLRHALNARQYNANVMQSVSQGKASTGKCKICGKRIAAKRLEILPQATTCAKCAREIAENNR